MHTSCLSQNHPKEHNIVASRSAMPFSLKDQIMKHVLMVSRVSIHNNQLTIIVMEPLLNWKCRINVISPSKWVDEYSSKKPLAEMIFALDSSLKILSIIPTYKKSLLVPGSTIRNILEDWKRAHEVQTLVLGAKRGFESGWLGLGGKSLMSWK